MKKRNLRRSRMLLERKRANAPIIFKQLVGFPLLMVILLTMVLSRRVRVANKMYGMSDGVLHAKGTSYVSAVNSASGLFTTPIPALAAISSALADFLTAINAAENGGVTLVSAKNGKREIVMNLLCALANYVEDVANDPANADPGPVTIIESAGMRAQPFTPRGKQIWDIFRGQFSGSIILTAAKVKRGTHDWQYTTTPTVEASWIAAPSTTTANTSIHGLTPLTYVYCRHRTVTKSGPSDWEGHDPIAIV